MEHDSESTYADSERTQTHWIMAITCAVAAVMAFLVVPSSSVDKESDRSFDYIGSAGGVAGKYIAEFCLYKGKRLTLNPAQASYYSMSPGTKDPRWGGAPLPSSLCSY